MDGKTPQTAPAEDLLASLGEYLKPELSRVDEILLGVLTNTPDALMREVGQFVFAGRGKKLRPSLTLLSAQVYGRNGAKPPIEAAAAMEAVHIATLIHDDVIDKAKVRRRQPSVNAQWGDDVAILMADYLYASAFELTLNHLNPELLRLLCQVTRRMCEGEMFQIEKRGKMIGVEDYYKLITAKTAVLFSACTGIGAMAAGAEAATVERLTNFGRDFGMAFQITDDTLDYNADGRVLGKNAGGDFAAGKQTLPFILARDAADDGDRRLLEGLLAEGADFEGVTRLLAKYSSIERALETAHEYGTQCAGRLEGLTARPGAGAELIAALPGYVTQRSY